MSYKVITKGNNNESGVFFGSDLEKIKKLITFVHHSIIEIKTETPQ